MHATLVGRRAVRFFLAAALVGCGATEATAQEHDLRLRLVEGQTYTQRSVQETKVSMNMMGQAQDTETRMSSGLSFHVRSVASDGNMTVEVTHESVAMNIQNPMMSVSYDSETDTGSPPIAAAGIAAMVGESFTIVFAPDGSVVESSGLAQLTEKVLNELPMGPEAAGLRESFEEQYGEDAFARTMGMMMGHLPGAPVAVGESWSRATSVSMGPAFDIDATWTLQGIEGDVAILDGTAILGNDTETVQEMGPMTMRYRLQGEQASSLRLDVNTGWILGGTIETTFAGEVVADTPQGTMTMPMEMTGTTTLTPIGGAQP